jgi:hypothetical protein
MRFLLASLSLCVALGAAETKTLPLELPKPAVAGTPRPFKVANLEAPRTTPRELPKVPAAATNLALGKEVTSNAREAVAGDLSYVTDGDKAGDEGYEVELPRGHQWVQIDLGSPAAIHALAVWHFHRERRVYFAVVVQLSDDPEFKQGVTTVFNNDDTNKLGLGEGKDPCYIESHEGRVIPVAGTKARYVRLHSNGNTSGASNDYVEVEVWGIPVK